MAASPGIHLFIYLKFCFSLSFEFESPYARCSCLTTVKLLLLLLLLRGVVLLGEAPQSLSLLLNKCFTRVPETEAE